MIDAEGPNPPDKHGNKYIFTYFDCLSHGILLEPMKCLNHSEVRRAFARCIFRSRSIPVMLRTDRGPKFRNALFGEYAALLGMRHRLATAMRPCEMGANERIHQETQKLLGLVLNDVAKGQPGDWSEFLVLVEYLIDLTPGQHGWAPRDLQCKWSLALPLEKDLSRLEIGKFEPVSDYARRLFQQYREVRTVGMDHHAKASETRSKLAKRFRRQTELKVGDRVVYRDPKA